MVGCPNQLASFYLNSNCKYLTYMPMSLGTLQGSRLKWSIEEKESPFIDSLEPCSWQHMLDNMLERKEKAKLFCYTLQFIYIFLKGSKELHFHSKIRVEDTPCSKYLQSVLQTLNFQRGETSFLKRERMVSGITSIMQHETNSPFPSTK